MYPTAFRLPVTLVRNLVPQYDMASHIIIPPPLNLTVGTTQSSLICSPVRLLTKVGPSLWNILNLDSSVNPYPCRMLSSKVSLRFLCLWVSIGFFCPTCPVKPTSCNRLRTVKAEATTPAWFHDAMRSGTVKHLFCNDSRTKRRSSRTLDTLGLPDLGRSAWLPWLLHLLRSCMDRMPQCSQLTSWAMETTSGFRTMVPLAIGQGLSMNGRLIMEFKVFCGFLSLQT